MGGEHLGKTAHDQRVGVERETEETTTATGGRREGRRPVITPGRNIGGPVQKLIRFSKIIDIITYALKMGVTRVFVVYFR